MSDGTPGGASGGLRGALGQLGSSLLALARTRIELAALEFDEERERAIRALILVQVAVVAFGMALLAGSALVVVLFWDRYGIGTLCALMGVYVLVGLVAVWRFTRRRPANAPPFAATLTELERDRAWLADQFGDGK